MNRFFDVDGPFLSGLTKVADIFILNILLVICSIPIFTIGASYTALYYVTLKMVKDEDCYIVKSFFRSFKQNFKQATAIWLILLFIGVILYMDVRVMSGDFVAIVSVNDSIAKVMSVMIMAAGLLYMFTIAYVFPVLARFDNTTKNTVKNALFMSIKHFPSTLAIIAIDVLPLIVMYFIPRAMILIFIAFALCAYCNSFFFVKIFKRYMPEEVIASDEEFEVSLDNK